MYDTPKDSAQVEQTIMALKADGIDAIIAKDGTDAKNKVLEMIPRGASVMTMTSVTLDTLGLTETINTSPDYASVRAQMAKMDPKTQKAEMRVLGGAPEYTVGSVHAVTMDGKVLIASNTGSQLPAYAYGAGKVIWVVGTQKIATDLDDGMKRVYDYVLPLEATRARKAYGIPENRPGSFVSKLLIVNKEITPGRITIVFVPENIGY